MSFFRDYLKSQNEQLGLRFEEPDENWFVFALILLRLGLRKKTWNLVTGRGEKFRGTDPLADAHLGPESGAALRFVSTFLCFFVPKPPRYRREIESFKNFFIPGFASNEEKQQLLFNNVRTSFSTMPLEEAKWDSVEEYFFPRYE